MPRRKFGGPLVRRVQASVMAVTRAAGRTSPITLILALLLGIGFVAFILPPSRSQNEATDHHLSPPTSPFRKPPESGQRRAPPVIHYKLDKLTASDHAVENKENVLILTPLARFYREYWENLNRLTYPHELISLGFIIPPGPEGDTTTEALQTAIAESQKGKQANRFASVTVMRQDFESPLHSQDEKERHKMENQKVRRAAMATARNSLLFTTIGPSTSWVLWLDSDIVETPKNLIQDLTRHNKDIIAPNCFQRYTNDKQEPDIRDYDFNSWAESDHALEMAKSMGPDEILLEGYAEMATYRALMAKLYRPGGNVHEEMPLDGVGGCSLLVKADVHRDGAMFPPFAFYHLIETEGFAKMAKRLGFKPYGLPNYLVFHHNE